MEFKTGDRVRVTSTGGVKQEFYSVGDVGVIKSKIENSATVDFSNNQNEKVLGDGVWSIPMHSIELIRDINKGDIVKIKEGSKVGGYESNELGEVVGFEPLLGAYVVEFNEDHSWPVLSRNLIFQSSLPVGRMVVVDNLKISAKDVLKNTIKTPDGLKKGDVGVIAQGLCVDGYYLVDFSNQGNPDLKGVFVSQEVIRSLQEVVRKFYE